MDNSNTNKTIKKNKLTKKFSTYSITVSMLITSAIQGIIGYIAVWFFKPIWEKFVNLFKKEEECPPR